MAYEITTPVIDSFQVDTVAARDIAPGWKPTWPLSSESYFKASGGKVMTNMALANTDESFAYKPDITLGGDHEVWATFGDTVASGFGVGSHWSYNYPGFPVISGPSGYLLTYFGTTSWRLFKYTNGSPTTLTTFTADAAQVGDKLALVRRGTRLVAVRVRAGTTLVLGSFEDTTYMSGSPMLYLSWSDVSCSEFGGGQLAPDPMAPKTPVFDTFDRANANPDPAWPAYENITGGGSALGVVSNQLSPITNFGASYWLREEFVGDQEFYATIAGSGFVAFDLARMWICARLGTGSGPTVQAYELLYNVHNGTFCELRRWRSNSSTTLVTWTGDAAIVAGDKLMVRRVGNVLFANVFRLSTGEWKTEASVEDVGATPGRRGYAVLYVDNAHVKYEDAGGGSFNVSSSDTVPTWAPLLDDDVLRGAPVNRVGRFD